MTDTQREIRLQVIMLYFDDRDEEYVQVMEEM